MNVRLDLLSANRLGYALYSPVFDDDPARPVNLARFTFLNPHATGLYPDWNLAADTTVAMLRTEAGRHPYDRELSDLIGELSTRSDTFRNRWAAHNVLLHRSGTKRFHHPVDRRRQLRLRSHGTLRRHRTDPHRLQPRARQLIPRLSCPTGELGRDPRRASAGR